MIQTNNKKEDQSAEKADFQDKDSKLISGLERLAFRLHDFANRLMGYLR